VWGTGLSGSPSRADPVGTLEVREHEDVEQFGAWRGTVNAEGISGLR